MSLFSHGRPPNVTLNFTSSPYIFFEKILHLFPRHRLGGKQLTPGAQKNCPGRHRFLTHLLGGRQVRGVHLQIDYHNLLRPIIRLVFEQNLLIETIDTCIYLVGMGWGYDTNCKIKTLTRRIKIEYSIIYLSATLAAA